MDTSLEAAADARAPFSTGACLPSSVVRTAQPRQGAIAFARPRASWGAGVFGQRHQAADLGVAVEQPDSVKNYPYPTRIAASGGGTKGPHPAREPDPV